MATRKAFLGASGERIIAVADGDYFTDNMSLDWSKAEQSSIQFFSDAEGLNQVTPTGGTVKVTGSPDEVTYFTLNNGDFGATDSYLETRVRPNGANAMVKAKLTLSGVTGAAYFKASMWRS
jgi:hypothetical protein